jgi:hypothetical protein
MFTGCVSISFIISGLYLTFGSYATTAALARSFLPVQTQHLISRLVRNSR